MRPFALVLAIWGSKYDARHVNEIASAAFARSPGLAEVVLLTDRPRPGVDPRVRQAAFPPPFDGEAFFGFGYRAKLAVFSPRVLPPGIACVFLDLDSVVVGDLGRIAALVRGPDDLLMLPPAGLGFGPLRRLADRLRGGRRFPVGNSSVLAFHSAADPNLAESYAAGLAAGELPGGSLVDDAVIAWFGRGRLRAVPPDAAVMLRREFLSRIPFWPALKARLPWVRARRARLAVVTLNGVAVKAETLAALPEGARLGDGRGRHGIWTDAAFGPVKAALQAASRRIAAGAPPAESDISGRK